MHLKVTKAAGEEILPVLWQDNYFPLLPGESRQVTATCAKGATEVAVGGWNAKAKTVTLK